MKRNLLNRAILAAVTIFGCISRIKEVYGNPLTIENSQQSGIYSERSWNNNDEPENSQRNAWIIDLNDTNKKDERNDENDCKGRGGLCNDQRLGVIRMPMKKEATLSTGWGAGGMPFNILYMKNPRPAKSLRSQILTPAQSTMYGVIAEPLQTEPISGPVPQAQRQYQVPQGHEDIPTRDTLMRSTSLQNNAMSFRNGRPRVRSSNGLIPSRRHYSIIPQLFVSYGWGPTTK